MVNQQLYPIIVINLSIVLIASWVFGYIIIAKIIKENKALKNTAGSENLKPKEAPVENEALSDTLDQLRKQFEERQINLSSFEALHEQQKLSLEMWNKEEEHDQEAYSQLVEQHNKSEALIKQLQEDIKESHLTIETLDNQLVDSDMQSTRIGILEQSEKRLKRQISANKKNELQIAQLAEGLQKAKSKNQTLLREKRQLKENIKKLTNASEKQLALIKKISDELEKASQLEQYQNQTIAELQKKIVKENASDSGSEKSKELEQELKDMTEKLERTMREKEFIESYLIEMDKTLEESNEAEKAIDESRDKIAEIEKTYPDFEVDETALSGGTAEPVSAANTPLSKLTVDEDNYPELVNIVNHNRLFGIINEYWNAKETPPIHLVSEKDITRPTTISHWLSTPLGHNNLTIVIGIHNDLAETLQQLIAQEPETQGANLEEALMSMGQKTAAALLEDLNDEYNLEASSYSGSGSLDEVLLNASVAAEALQESKNQPLYIALIQTA